MGRALPVKRHPASCTCHRADIDGERRQLDGIVLAATAANRWLSKRDAVWWLSLHERRVRQWLMQGFCSPT
jgi:hypothetical protein